MSWWQLILLFAAGAVLADLVIIGLAWIAAWWNSRWKGGV